MNTVQMQQYVNQALQNLETALFKLPTHSHEWWNSWFCRFLESKGVYGQHTEACLVLFMELGRRGVVIKGLNGPIND